MANRYGELDVQANLHRGWNPGGRLRNDFAALSFRCDPAIRSLNGYNTRAQAKLGR
jgi:hypothetical protein